MSHRTIGTCSICGGAVVTPGVWLAKDSDAALWDFVNRGRLPPD